jgi:HK97 family phage prohead protease
MKHQKAWSTFVVKTVDEDARVLTGIASTPSVDRTNDIVEPMGAEFALPLPFLWQHDSAQPIGHVTAAKPTASGIPVTIELVKIAEPGTLKDRLDEAWQSIKSGLVRGLSIGFAAVEYSFKDDGGIHFTKWSWLELSAVTIPANADASITSIKAADLSAKAAVRDGLDAYRESSAYENLKALALKWNVPSGIFKLIDLVHFGALDADGRRFKQHQDLDKRVRALEALAEGATKVERVEYVRSVAGGPFVFRKIHFANGAVKTETLTHG